MNFSLSKNECLAVDSHFHVFDADTACPGARYVPSYPASLAMWQRQARAVGVGRGVLVQTSFMGTDNRLLLSLLAQEPETLRGVVVVSPEATLADLAPWHALGVRGIRLNLAGQSHDVSVWLRASALWDALLQLGWHVELHTDVGALPAVLGPWPQQLALVIDHMGKPEAVSASDATVQAVRQRVAPVHIKLSGAYRLVGRHAGELARLWRAELGDQALLWGSDWPCTNHENKAHYPALFEDLAHWLQDDAAVTAARVHNPVRLYGFTC